MRVDELAERKYEILVLKHVKWLKTERSYVVAVSKIEDISDWRRAARAAGRRLKIRVRTGISRDGTLVWVTEDPVENSDPDAAI